MSTCSRQNPRVLRAVLVAAGLVMAPLAQANLVLNGSFETTTATQTDYFIGKVANWGNSDIGESIVLPSWYTLGYLFPGVGVAGALPQSSPDGGNFVYSDGDYHNSAITQTLTGLTPGATYAISFWEGLIQDTEVFTTPGPVTGYWHVSLGSNSANGAFMTGNGITNTFTNWQQETLYLTANSATETLSFLSVGTGDPPLVLLDGIDVTAVPEPATLGLTLAAALAGGALYRRRRWAGLPALTLPGWLLDGWRLEGFRLLNGLLLLIAVFVPLERLFALRRGARPERWTPDVAWYFVTSLLPNRLVALPLALALLALPGWQGLWPQLAELPLAARLPLALLVAELGFYWGHRALHASPWLWPFHALHHGAERLDWLVNTRAHPVDVAFVRLCGLVPLYALGLARSGTHAIDGLPLGVALAANLWGYLLHANLRWRFGPLEWLVATPRFHHWHHERLDDSQGHAHGNYAALLPALDALFGTLRLPRNGWPARYGTAEPPQRAWLDQLMAPFMQLLDRRHR